MSKQHRSRSRTLRNARRRRVQRKRGKPSNFVSIHRLAIDRLWKELRAGVDLVGRFHGGVAWRGMMPLLKGRDPATLSIRAEVPLKASGRRYIPDLVVHCGATGRLLLAIEVWHTHAVSAMKRQAYQAARIPWIEVRAWAVICWRRGQALPVLDWGGIDSLDAPTQVGLFESEPHAAKPPQGRVTEQFSVRSSDWRLPAPGGAYGHFAFSDASFRLGAR